MPNPAGYIPDNILSNALSEIAGMREVNRELRSLPAGEEPAPLTEDEVVAEFARTTGQVINHAGESVGKTCGGTPQGEPCLVCGYPSSYHGGFVQEIRNPPRAKINDAPVVRITEPPPTERSTVFGKRKPFVPGSKLKFESIQGVDIENGTVLIDGYEFELDEPEVREVARFCVQVMMRTIQRQIEAMAGLYGINQPPPETPKPEGADADVPEVPEGETGSGVPEAPGKE